MASLCTKNIHATYPLSSTIAAATLILLVIHAVAMAAPDANPGSEAHLFREPEKMRLCTYFGAEDTAERAFVASKTAGSPRRCLEPYDSSIGFSRRVRRDRYADKQKETATLAFVFDTTGSMSEDLAQAREGAKAILKAFTEREIMPVSNFILVPFNDPDIQPMTVTESPDDFVKALDRLTVGGGGDCPELACAGILQALQNAHPYSYLYVFTDAPAKDHHLYDDILALIQRKHSMVSFFLSGLCGYTEESVKVYDHIAAASGGRVFSVTKHDIKMVLNFVRDTLRGGDETIYSVIRPTPITKEPHSESFNVTVEIGLEEFVVTLTGNKPAVVVINPLGVIMRNLKTILQLSNVMVVSVLNPEPGGIWKVEVTIQPKRSTSATIPDGFALQVKATGVTYKIQQGFSIKQPNSLKETAIRPLEGTKNYLLIAIIPLHENEETNISLEKYTWESVDIRKLDGGIHSTETLQPVMGKEQNETQMLVFSTGPFDIPFDLFTLTFHGFDGNGNPVSRLSSNAISSAPLSPPLVTMKTEKVGSEGKELTLHCEVESLTAFTLDWYKNGLLFLGNLTYEQSHDAQLIIPSAQKDDEGLYTCKATNTKGSTLSPQGTSVTIIGPPVIVQMKSTKTIIPENHTVMLDCEAESEVSHTIQWTLEHEGHLERLSNGHPSERIQLLSNNSLLITSFHHNDSGLYTCSAENMAGMVNREMELLLVMPPAIETSKEEEFYFTKGDEMDLECKVKGKVGSNISWEFNGKPLLHLIKSSTKYAHSIAIPSASKDWEGNYTCIAENEAGIAQKEIKAIYWEPPIVQPQTEPYMTYVTGDLAVMSCLVSEFPEPTVTWLHNDKIITNNQYFELSVDGLSLSIHGFSSATEGFYTCKAHSILNSTSESYFRLLLGTPPKPSNSPHDAIIKLGEEEWLHCNAEVIADTEKFPQLTAKTSWKRENDIPIDLMRHEVLASGTLHLIDFKEEDQGLYICTIENDYGKVDFKAKLRLEGSTNAATPRFCIMAPSVFITLNFFMYLISYMLTSHCILRNHS